MRNLKPDYTEINCTSGSRHKLPPPPEKRSDDNSNEEPRAVIKGKGDSK